MNREIHILFTSIGRRVELVEAFQKAAQKLGVKLVIYGADVSKTAPALFYCDEIVEICKIMEPKYISELIKICEKNKIDALIPTIDTDLLMLSSNKEKFEKIGTKVYVSSYEHVKLCRDKRLTSEFFNSCGLHSPSVYDNINKYHGKYPAFIKPIDGSSSIDAYMVKNIKELKLFSEKIGEYIIQPYIEGKEYTIDIFCNYDGSSVFITPRERLAVRSGEVLKTRISQDDIIIEEMKKLIETFRPCGQITVQLIQERSLRENYYIEINPRFGGGAPLSIKAGADSAMALLLDVMGKQLSFQPYAALDNAVFSRFDQSICVQEGTKKKHDYY